MLCHLVGTYLRRNGPDDKVCSLAIDWAKRCQPPLPREEVVKTVTALVKKHTADPSARHAPDRKLKVVCYSDIEPEEVQWLWPNRIALGKLTMISGDPGLGKSFLAVDLSARVSTGRGFPDGGLCPLGDVLFATLEDGAADTIRPRLDAHAADVNRVYHLAGVGDDDPLQLDIHIGQLQEQLEGNQGVRLLVLDPISAFMGDTDSHKNAEVRRVLGPLGRLAEEHGVAVVAINHLAKSQHKAIYRTMGSVAFVAAARAAWIVGADPDDESRRLFLPAKNNLGSADGLAYRITNGAVAWEDGPVFMSPDDLEDDSETPRKEAKEWLRAALADGSVPSSAIYEKAKTDGIAKKTLERAKKELGVESTQSGRAWTWSLPTGEPDAAGQVADEF
jgi:hypothetical protein